MEHYSYMGDGPKPILDDDFRIQVALKYIEAFERITGSHFSGANEDSSREIKDSIREFLERT